MVRVYTMSEFIVIRNTLKENEVTFERIWSHSRMMRASNVDSTIIAKDSLKI